MRRIHLLVTVLSMVLFSVSACKCNKEPVQQEEMGTEPAPEPAPVEVAPSAPAPDAAAPAPAPAPAGEDAAADSAE